jgi:tetratricopeptide (TPR) repeat protein
MGKRGVIIGLLMSLILALGVTSGRAQTSATLVVTCVDAAGQPLKDVAVSVVSLQAPKALEAKSDKEGKAVFKKVDPGIYRVLGRRKGYEPAYREPITVVAEKETTVTLAFQTGEMTKQLYFENPALVQQANQLLQTGLQALQQQRFSEAEEKLAQFLQIATFHAEGRFWYGVALAQQRKWDQGEKEIRMAVELNPNEPRYREVLDRLSEFRKRDELHEAGQRAMQNRDFKTAIAKFAELLALQPENTDVRYNLALAYANDGQYDKAIEIIDEAIRQRPQEAEYQRLKSQILEHKEYATIQKANEILAEGDQLLREGKYQDALQKYETARAMISREEPSIWFAIGRCYVGLQQVDKAIAAYQKAIELNPRKPEYHQALALIYLNAGRLDEAIRTYTEAYRQLGEPVDERLFELGQRLVQENKLDMAARVFEHVLEVNPNHAESYYELGVYNFYSADKGRARALLTKYLEIGKDPKHVEDAKNILAVMERQARPRRR